MVGFEILHEDQSIQVTLQRASPKFVSNLPITFSSLKMLKGIQFIVAFVSEKKSNVGDHVFIDDAVVSAKFTENTGPWKF
jgi:hypothetical protein